VKLIIILFLLVLQKKRTEINIAILKQFKNELGFMQGLENDNNISILQLKNMREE
jgi:hypothetical protein